MGLASRCPGEERGRSVCPICAQILILPLRLMWDWWIPWWMLSATGSLVPEGRVGESSPLWFMLWPRLIFAPLQKDIVGKYPGMAAAVTHSWAFICLTDHQHFLIQMPVCVRPWLCKLTVHDPNRSQVGKIRQHPPTMSQINPWGYITSVNRTTGLNAKLCLCSHQCCQFLQSKVDKVTHVECGGQLQRAVVQEL